VIVMTDGGSRRQLPGWLFVVVPMVLAAVLVGGAAIAVRSGDEDGSDEVSGPATGLPAVVDAADALLGSRPASADMAGALGRRYGDVTVGFTATPDPVDFAEQFDRLPDAEASALGRTLGAIQAELSPTAVGGSRDESERADDIVFALELARGTVQAIDPDASARDQALAVLPFAVQDLVGFDEIATTFATGDLAPLAARIDSGESGETGTRGVLSDAGAAEVISSVAFLLGQRIPADDDLSSMFMDAYNAELP
jgi:hypothetical protein